LSISSGTTQIAATTNTIQLRSGGVADCGPDPGSARAVGLTVGANVGCTKRDILYALAGEYAASKQKSAHLQLRSPKVTIVKKLYPLQAFAHVAGV
jgi:hypothetical protein